MSTLAPQLLLEIGLSKEHSFENYIPPVANDVCGKLKYSVFESRQPFVYLVGPKDCGKTHLSIASHNFATKHDLNSYYVSCRDVRNSMSGEEFETYLEHLKSFDFLVLDGVEAFFGDALFEIALFSLYNHYRDLGLQMLCSARDLPQHLGIKLPDLDSRMRSGLTISVQQLSEDEMKQALDHRARERGIVLSEEVINFVYLRSSRSLGALLGVLDRLDHAQLVEKRSLTVPFVKKVLGL